MLWSALAIEIYWPVISVFFACTTACLLVGYYLRGKQLDKANERLTEVVLAFRNDSRSKADTLEALIQKIDTLDKRQSRLYSIAQTTMFEARDLARTIASLLRVRKG